MTRFIEGGAEPCPMQTEDDCGEGVCVLCEGDVGVCVLCEGDVGVCVSCEGVERVWVSGRLEETSTEESR